MEHTPASEPDLSPPERATIRALPSGIWALGVGSLFMDTSSELVHSLLPVFMTSVLGASMVTIGLVEGVAEATASIVKVFSGAISDALGKRKDLVVFGYGLGALTKPVFALATSMTWVFGARFVDRMGKGIRGAPRDALVADITPPELRGSAYGLRQSLDSIGALAGPLLAVVLMVSLANDIRAVMWVAVAPAIIAVVVLLTAVHEPDRHEASPRTPLAIAAATRLSRRYWLIVGLGALFTLARFSEAFLVLRAQSVGLPIAYVPAVMIVMNVVYAGGAFPAGVAADRMSRRWLLVAGLALLVAADLVLASAHAVTPVLIGAALWGGHMALTQGLFAKLVADVCPVELRGTGFGVFNLVSGGALLLASVIAGALWNTVGAAATFLAGAVFAALTLLGLLAYRTAPAGRVRTSRARLPV